MEIFLKIFIFIFLFFNVLILTGARICIAGGAVFGQPSHLGNNRTTNIFNPENFTQVLNFKLEESTLYGIRNVLGYTPILEKGHTSEYEARIVYFINSGSEKIEFFSDELHGADLGLSDFAVSKVSQTEKFKKKELSIKKINVCGLHLGMERKDVDKLINIKNIAGGFSCAVEKKSNDEIIYHFFKGIKWVNKKKEIMEGEEGIDISMIYQGGILSSFSVGKATST